jgi:uncharacterized membrane protein YbhN (UPF0104 family)
MKKAVRRILRIGAVIASLLIVVLLAAILLVRFNKPLIRNIIQSQLAKRTGTAVRIGRLDYALFPFRLTVRRSNSAWKINSRRWSSPWPGSRPKETFGRSSGK